MAIKTLQKVFVDKDGNETRHAHAGAVALVFRFANGHEITFQPSKVSDDIRTCLTLHGASQKGGDSCAGSDTIDDAIESVEGVLENLYEGIWIERAEGAGFRTSLLAEALHDLKPDKYPTVEAAAIVVKKWDKDERKKKLEDVPELAAAYKGVQARRAVERAEAAKKKAAEAAGPSTGLADL